MSDFPKPDDEWDELVAYEQVPTLNEQVHQHYQEIGSLISAIPSFIDEHSDNKEVLLHTLALHQALIKGLKRAEEYISSAIIDANMVPYGGERVEGVGFVEVHRTGDKKRTDNALIVGQIQKQLGVRYAVDAETGAVDQVAMEAVVETVDEMCKLVGAYNESFNTWRKGAAKELNIDINKYESREGGRLVVTIK